MASPSENNNIILYPWWIANRVTGFVSNKLQLICKIMLQI